MPPTPFIYPWIYPGYINGYIHGYIHGYMHAYIHGYVHGYVHGYTQIKKSRFGVETLAGKIKKWGFESLNFLNMNFFYWIGGVFIPY